MTYRGLTRLVAGDEQMSNETRSSTMTFDAPDLPGGTIEIEIARPATLSGIWADLLIHTPTRRGRSWLLYIGLLIAFALFSSGFHMVALYRVGAFFHKLRLRPVCIVVEKIIYHWYHCLLPCSVKIGKGLWVPHPLNIVLASRARLGRDVWLRQGAQIVHVNPEDEGTTGIVGDRVRLSADALLIKGAIIGEDSIAAARSLIAGPVPPRHLAVGVPATSRPLRPEQILDRPPRYR
jgi:serine O-acetyltransferase